MAITTLSFVTTFNRITGLISVEDTTDYAALGFILGTNSNMEGFLRVTYDIGSGETVIYDNLAGATPDLSNNLGPDITFSATIDIPVVSDDIPLPATYRVTYVSNVYFGLLQETGTLTNAYDYNIDDAEICINTRVECMASALQSEDATDYTIDNATFNSVVRAHTLYPPPTSGLSNMGPLNLSTLIYTPIATSAWYSEIISTVTYTLTSGLIVIVQLSGTKKFDVDCDNNLNAILCCLVSVQAQYEEMVCSNPVKAANYKKTVVDPTFAHLVLFLAAQQAGNGTKMASEYAAILAVSGCDEDCGCTSNVSIVQVSGVNGATAAYAVDSPNGTIQVVGEVNGNVTTFHLELSAALLSILSNVGSTIVTTTTPSFLTITQIGTAPNYNYRVDFNPSAFGDIAPEISMRIETTVPAASPYAVGVLNVMNVSGGMFNPAASFGIQIGQGSPNVGADVALFRVTNFLAGTAVDYVLTPSYMNLTANATDLSNIQAEVFWFDSVSTTGDFIIRLLNPSNGQPYTLTQLGTLIGSGTSHISIILKAKV